MAETTYGAEVIARLLVITPRRLQQLTKEGYLPKSAAGTNWSRSSRHISATFGTVL